MDIKTTQEPEPSRLLTGLLAAVFVINQLVIGTVAQAVGHQSALNSIVAMGMPKQAMAMTIVMPILNDDGKTTSLTEMPTISEVPANPHSGDAVADGMAVMVGTGSPDYAPSGISFDDAVGALSAWGNYASLDLPSDLEDRYNRLIMVFTCNFCCGGPMDVAINGRCGCAHAQAARGFFRYMLSNYGDNYSDDQLVGEAYRWQAIWYPSGVVEDYLLYSGQSDVLGHQSHGGAGSDGMHGLGSN